MSWLQSVYLQKEGGKNVINQKSLKYTFSILIGLTALVQIFRPEDDSFLSKSHRPFESNETIEQIQARDRAENLVNAHDSEARANQSGGTNRARPPKLVYNGRQVFERDEKEGSLTSLPSGTNFIGKLINGIDTREPNQVLKVILPYGARSSSGGTIPRDSILLGNVNYGGKGNRVYARFNRIIFPTGREYKIDAQALSSGDYTPGLIGEHHSQADLRMAGSLGLTMISAATDVLTERATHGGMNQFGQVAVEPKPNMRNAALQGVSQVSKQEAQRHTEEMQNEQEYITVQTGGDLIVSLLTPFKGESF